MYHQEQHPVGAPPSQGYPPASYPPPGYAQGYPAQGYPPPQYSQASQQKQQAGRFDRWCVLDGCLAALWCCCWF